MGGSALMEGVKKILGWGECPHAPPPLPHYGKPWIHSKAEQLLGSTQLQEKEAQKDQHIQEICLESAYREKMPLNSRLEDT